jgi:hypothetical protein
MVSIIFISCLVFCVLYCEPYEFQACMVFYVIPAVLLVRCIHFFSNLQVVSIPQG